MNIFPTSANPSKIKTSIYFIIFYGSTTNILHLALNYILRVICVVHYAGILFTLLHLLKHMIFIDMFCINVIMKFSLDLLTITIVIMYLFIGYSIFLCQFDLYSLINKSFYIKSSIEQTKSTSIV